MTSFQAEWQLLVAHLWAPVGTCGHLTPRGQANMVWYMPCAHPSRVDHVWASMSPRRRLHGHHTQIVTQSRLVHASRVSRGGRICEADFAMLIPSVT
jgi:hypothetical protein